MGGWGCPHEIGGKCMRIKGIDCDPGMKGCILSGRFRFSNDDKNRAAKPPREIPGDGRARRLPDAQPPGTTEPPPKPPESSR